MQFDTNNYIELENVAKILNTNIPKIKNQLQFLNEIPIRTTNNKLLITDQQFMTLKNHYYPHFNIDKALKYL